MTDLDTLALTIWGEARGEPIEGQIAVAHVVRNRIALGRWGATASSVCRAPMQFSCWNEGTDANHQAVMALADLVEAGHIPADPRYRQADWIASGVLSGVSLDNTRGATYYYVTNSPEPAWAQGQTPCAIICSHSFFKGIA